MKPLLPTVVAISLLMLIHAHPDNIEEVKDLSESDKPVLDEAESQPQTRVERCTTCAGTLKLNLKSPKETLEALKNLPGGVVHTQQSFEGCSSDKGCAGLKVKDGKVIEKFGNIDDFKAAVAANLGNEFSFHSADNQVFEGGLPGSGPYWWMNKDSPFKNAGASGKFEKYSKSSSSSFSTGAGVGATGLGANAALDLTANPFLNGDFSKIAAGGLTGAGQIGAGVNPSSSFQSSFESSSFSASNKGDIDITKNPFLNGGINFGAGLGGAAIGAQNAAAQAGFGSVAGAAQSGFGAQNSGATTGFASQSGASTGFGSQGAGTTGFGAQNGASTGFGSQSFEANSQSSYSANAGGKFGGYTGSSPSPFTPTGSNVNLIQNAQKTNEFNYQTQQNIDEAFQSTGNVQANAGGDLQETCAGQGYVCVPKAQCNNGVVNTNGAGLLQANTKKQYCNLRLEICCRIEISSISGVSNIQGSLGVGAGTFQGSAAQGSGLFASGAQGSQSTFGAQGQTNAFGASGQTNSLGVQGQSAFGGQSQFGAQAGQTNLGATSVNRQTGFGVQGQFGQGFGTQTGQTNIAAGSVSKQAGFGASAVNKQTGFGAQGQFGAQAGQTNIAAGSVNRQSGFGRQGQFGVGAGQTTIGAGSVSKQSGFGIGQTTIGAGSVNKQSGFGTQTQFGVGQSNIGASSVNRQTGFGTQGQFGVGAGQTTIGAGVNRQTGFGVSGSVDRQTGLGVTTAYNANANRVQSTVPFGIGATGTTTSFGSTGSVNRATGSSFEASRGSTFNSNKFGSTNAFGSTIGSTLAPTTPGRFGTGQSSFIATDSLTAGSKTEGVYRPGGVGTVLKPGIPYLPPVEVTNSPVIVTTPRPYTTPKPTYIPPVSSTSAPGYLPPIGEQTINRETRLPPGPNYKDGELYLDQVINPATPVLVPSQIPSGCAAALKCTPIEFCTADGIISNTSVILTRDQDAYRVPLTDCKDVATGIIGKCCRDPFYTDPWPVNQLGKWVPNTFGGNDGKYVPDNFESPSNPRIDKEVFRTSPKPTTPFVPYQVTTPTSLTIGGGGQITTGGRGQYTVGGGGQYTKVGVGQVTVGGGGQYTKFGGGQVSTGGGGQITNDLGGQLDVSGSGQYTKFGQVATGGGGRVVTGGGGQVVTGGGGRVVTGGGGQVVTGGGGQLVTGGGGQVVTGGGGGQYTKFGQVTTGGRGQVVSGGGGQVVTGGGGQLVTGGGGQIVTGGGGQYTKFGQVTTGGRGQVVSTGTGQYNKFGQLENGGGGLVASGGVGQVTVGGGGQYTKFGTGQYTKFGAGRYTKYGEGNYTVDGGEGGSESRVFLQRYDGSGECGRLNGGKPYGNRNDNEVDFGEIPWQAMVLLQTNKSLLCGGVITRPEVVITSASCVEGLEAKNVLIKGGEWKLGIDEEPLPFQIVQVKHILRHPFYKKGSLHYDAAILVLAENLRWAQNIQPICLPKLSDTLEGYYNGAGKCIVTGWGKQVLQTHQLGSIMHSINVSLINSDECQAKLSQNYPHLLEQYNEDSCVCGQPTNPLNNICRVDIGSALACTTGDGYFVMQGVYSWDSGCQIGNQIAAFYKFDLEWYEWSIGLYETTKYTITVTKIISNSKGAEFNSGLTSIGGATGGGKVTVTGSATKYTTGNTGLTSGFNGAGKTGSASFVSGTGAGSAGKFTGGGAITGDRNGGLISSGLQTGKGQIGFGQQQTGNSQFTSQFSSTLNGGSKTGSFGGAVTGTGAITGGNSANKFGQQQTGSQFSTQKVSSTFSSGSKSGSFGGAVTGSGAITGGNAANKFGQTTGQFSTQQFGSAFNGGSQSGSFGGTLTGSGAITGSGANNYGQEQTVIKTNKVTEVTGTIKGGKVSFLDIAKQAGLDLSGKDQFGFGKQTQSQFSTGQVSQGFDSGVKFSTQLNAPITKSFQATYTQQKVFQSEPQVISYTTKPEIVTYTIKPEVFTYTLKPELVTYTFKPETYTYTSKPQIIRYETSGSGTNPQYVAPEKSYQPFAELVSGHKHGANCKCNEGKK